MVLEKVTGIIANVCSIHPALIVADRDLMAYGMDSARAMDLVVEVEDTFNVEISDEVMIGLRTANDIVQALANLTV